MKKKFLLLAWLLFLVYHSAIALPDSLHIKIKNQYEAEISGATITVLKNGYQYTTDPNGNATLAAVIGDSITIEKKGYTHAPTAITTTKGEVLAVIKKNFSWKDLITPMFYIINGGLWMLLLIIFAETGLFIGFFFPGDSLLFVAGIFSDTLAASLIDSGNSIINLCIVIGLSALAGILGNAVGYWFGKRIGHVMFNWNDNLLFKKKYLHQAHEFYEKYGGGAIVFARFIPIVRTFAPIIAGIVEMDNKKFTYYNIIGCVAWVGSMIVGGHFLQKWILQQFHFDLKQHLEVIVLCIVLVTTAPVIIKLALGKAIHPKQTS